MSSNVLFMGVFDKRSKPTIRRHADIIEIDRVVRRAKRPAAIKKLTDVLLVDIVVADFRFSERTIWEDYINKHNNMRRIWRDNETVVFISLSGKQAIWIVGETRLNESMILDTRRWRITGPGAWTDDNLVLYANEVGFNLIIPSEKTIKEVMTGAA